MRRRRPILTIIALVLLGGILISGTQSLFLQQDEELVKGREAERELVEEGKEGKDWFRFLSSGGADGLIGKSSDTFQQITEIRVLQFRQRYLIHSQRRIALFLKYCRLKVDCPNPQPLSC